MAAIVLFKDRGVSFWMSNRVRGSQNPVHRYGCLRFVGPPPSLKRTMFRERTCKNQHLSSLFFFLGGGCVLPPVNIIKAGSCQLYFQNVLFANQWIYKSQVCVVWFSSRNVCRLLLSRVLFQFCNMSSRRRMKMLQRRAEKRVARRYVEWGSFLHTCCYVP